MTRGKCNILTSRTLCRSNKVLCPILLYLEFCGKLFVFFFGNLAPVKRPFSSAENAVKNLSGGKVTQTQINQWKSEYDNFAWVVAMAPADDPKIAVAVLIFQGGTAGYAATVAREVIGKYLNLEGEYTDIDMSTSVH